MAEQKTVPVYWVWDKEPLAVACPCGQQAVNHGYGVLKPPSEWKGAEDRKAVLEFFSHKDGTLHRAWYIKGVQHWDVG